MQQTKKYKFDLIDWMEDDFSSGPLNQNMEKMETELARVEAETENALAAKAEQTALESLSGQVGALEQGRLRFVYDTYTGTGTYGKSHPTRLEFPFKPLMVLIVDTSSVYYGGFPWLNGMTKGHSYLDSSSSYNMLTWEARAVQWYDSFSNADAVHQLNESGRKYYYLGLGISE